MSFVVTPIPVPKFEQRGEDFGLTSKVGVQLNHFTGAVGCVCTNFQKSEGRGAEIGIVEEVDMKLVRESKGIRDSCAGRPRDAIDQDDGNRGTIAYRAPFNGIGMR